MAMRDLITSGVALLDAPLAALISEIRRLRDHVHGWTPISWREPCAPCQPDAGPPGPVPRPGSGAGAGGAG
ncbi:hypothetical protein, partial [Frankia sp. CiP1_Cm_nod1]|uniref:hypothetical protein n=1 Tax=Frankia sp. CiP1_Cm_nod1 TaxID=2897160 RepID=UPI00202418A5